MNASPLFLSAVLSLVAAPLVSANGGTARVAASTPAARVEHKAPKKVCDAFDGESTGIDLFGVYVAPVDNDQFDSSLGAGLGFTSYLNSHLGFSTSVYFWDSGETTVLSGTGSMILRAPIKALCIAPYAIGGIGGHINAREEFTFHAGVGLEIRVPGINDWGAFMEGTYNWAEETGDYATVRLGARYHF